MTTTEVRPDETKARPAGKGKAGKTAKGGKGKSKKKLIIIVVLLLAVAGAGYKFFLAKPTPPGPPAGGEIVQLDPETVNLNGGHYLKVAVAVQVVQGKSTAADFQGSKAEQLIIDEFSNRTVPSLSINTARKKLAAELEKKIKSAYDGEVFTIFLTQFVMQ
jgi:flagellar protein FliL